jgi:hypothetical protein
MMLGAFLAAAAATAPVPALTSDWWSDYYDTPSQGLAKGELSVVVAEITVNKNGYFDGCAGHVYSGNPQMGPYVCSRLKMRAGFEPARGPDGRKVIGVYRKLIVVANVTQETRFKMPNFGIHLAASGPVPGDNPFEIQFYLDANGKVSECSLVDAVGVNMEKHKQVVDAQIVQRACAEVSTQLKPVPPPDKHGVPIPTAQNALVVVSGDVNSRNQ